MVLDDFGRAGGQVLTLLSVRAKALSSSVRAIFAVSDTWDKDKDRERIELLLVLDITW